MVDGFIRSKGYVPGSAGWTINADGSAEFGDVILSKLTFNRLTMTPNLESIDGWGTSITGVGAAITPKASTVLLIGGNVVGDITRMYIEPSININTDKNPQFQCYAILSLETVPLGDTIVGFGAFNPFTTAYIGFKRLASTNTLYAVAGGSSTLITGIATDIFHSYQINVDNVLKEVYFYIDRVLKATISYTGVLLDSDFAIMLAIKSGNASNNHRAIIGGLFYSQDF